MRRRGVLQSLPGTAVVDRPHGPGPHQWRVVEVPVGGTSSLPSSYVERIFYIVSGAAETAPINIHVTFSTPALAAFRAAIDALPDDIEQHDIVNATFLLGREGRLAVYYAPLEGVN